MEERISKFSPMTHCDVITMLSDYVPLEHSLKMRFCKFVQSVKKNGSEMLKSVANIALENPFSLYGQNYCNIIHKYNSFVSCRELI